MTGRPMSQSTISGLNARALSIPSGPSLATSTTWLSSSRATRRLSAASGLSSMMRTRRLTRRGVAAAFRELGGVQEEVHDHLRKPCRVAVHPEWLGGKHRAQRDTAFDKFRAHVFNHLADQLVQVEPAPLQLNLAPGDARHVEEV